MIINWGDKEPNIMCSRIQSVDSVPSHREIAILSSKFRITEHAQSSAVEYLNFFLQNSVPI